MDRLARAGTLGAIIDQVNRHLSLTTIRERRPIEANGRNGDGPTDGKPVAHVGTPSRVRRMVLEAIDVPLAESDATGGLRPGGVVLMTDDGRGVAVCAQARLRSRGLQVVRLAHSPGLEIDSTGEVWSADLTSAAQVGRLVERVRAEGTLCGVLHLLTLRRAEAAGLDAAIWSERVAVELRSLFLIARETADDLACSAAFGGAALVAATGMGGSFASLAESPDDFFPGHGGVAGLVKTLAREWDGVRLRVVDVAADDAPEELAGVFEDELLCADGRTEVGYLQGRRIALRPVEVSLPPGSGPGVVIRPGDPILITGGARGITAAVALDLAERWRPTLLLVGTSPPPGDGDDPELAGLFTPAEVKARLLERLTRAGRAVGPAELERAYWACRKDQEIRANLRSLRALGAVVEYAQVDVRDAKALKVVLDLWRARYGPLAGLVHGAGVIEDKRVNEKSPESFDRVVGTKLDGALNLAGLIDPKELRFTAFFSSVAGRFGNQGQADYAAANETLNKLAVWLDRRWPGRVVSIIWGPWSGVGMGSDLEGHLSRRGLGMIDPEDGRARLGAELVSGRKGEVEIIVAGELGDLIDTPEAVSSP